MTRTRVLVGTLAALAAIAVVGRAACSAELTSAESGTVPTTTTPLTTTSQPLPAAAPAAARRFCPPGAGAAGSACRITAPPSGEQARPEGAPPLLASERPTDLGTAALPDAADPFVLVDGQTYFLFTTSAGFLNVPVATFGADRLVESNNGNAIALEPPWPIVLRAEAMPAYPSWAAPGGIWAPTVGRFLDKYVMFFAAKRPAPPDPANAECIGRAFSNHPEGPYLPEARPFTCGVEGVHGALDPEIVRTSEGKAYLLAAFGGTSTMLWSIPLNSGAERAGKSRPLLRIQQRWESWFLENPSMVFDGEHYTLAYSVGDWKLPSYRTGIARCRTPVGPCRSSRSGPWLSATDVTSGPGGLSFFYSVDGRLMAAHHGYEAGKEALFGARSTFIRQVKLSPRRIALR